MQEIYDLYAALDEKHPLTILCDCAHSKHNGEVVRATVRRKDDDSDVVANAVASGWVHEDEGIVGTVVLRRPCSSTCLVPSSARKIANGKLPCLGRKPWRTCAGTLRSIEITCGATGPSPLNALLPESVPSLHTLGGTSSTPSLHTLMPLSHENETSCRSERRYIERNASPGLNPAKSIPTHDQSSRHSKAIGDTCSTLSLYTLKPYAPRTEASGSPKGRCIERNASHGPEPGNSVPKHRQNSRFSKASAGFRGAPKTPKKEKQDQKGSRTHVSGLNLSRSLPPTEENPSKRARELQRCKRKASSGRSVGATPSVHSCVDRDATNSAAGGNEGIQTIMPAPYKSPLLGRAHLLRDVGLRVSRRCFLHWASFTRAQPMRPLAMPCPNNRLRPLETWLC